jgi:hypothetical protein
LHSIIGASVLARSSATMLAVIAAISDSLVQLVRVGLSSAGLRDSFVLKKRG